MSTEPVEKKAFWLLRLYNEAVKNSPLLKYSRVLVVAAIILALIALFKLRPENVFIFAMAVLFASLIAFLISLLIRSKRPIYSFLRSLLTSCIVLTSACLIIGFGIFTFTGYPVFFKRWFPDQRIPAQYDPPKPKPIDSTQRVSPPTKPIKHPSKQPLKSKILSIQLGQATDGYGRIYVGGKQVEPLPESTPYNPRIDVSPFAASSLILIIGKNGDSCFASVPKEIDSTIYRVVPNCK